MSYSQLCPEERYGLALLLGSGESFRQIAKKLNRSVSTISREINRNKGKRGYKHKQAGRLSQERHKQKARPLN